MSTSKRFVTKNGLDNNGNSITNLGVSGASLTLSGANAITLTSSGPTTLTLPTSGTLLTTAGTAATVTTNANLTGPITSVGNATSIASQTGTGTQFVMSVSPTVTGYLSITGSGANLPASTNIASASAATGASLITSQGTAGTAGAAFITFHRPAAHAFHVGIDTDNYFKIGGYSLGAVSYKIWHEGVDGAGSGLDADLLDGQQGSYYLSLSNATNTLLPANTPASIYSSTSTDGSYFSNGMYYNAGWKHLGTNTYGHVLRNSGVSGAQLFVASTAGTPDSAATYSTYTFAPNGTLTTTGLSSGTVTATSSGSRFSDLSIGADTDIYLYESSTNAFSIRTGASGSYKFTTFAADGTLAVNNGGITTTDKILVAGTTAVTLSNGETPYLQLNGTDSRWGIGLSRWSANANGTGIYLGKSRGATVGTFGIVSSGDELGRITFSGDDGTDVNTIAAQITAYVDGTPGVNDMPGRLVFSTTADGASTPTAQMTIANGGNITLGTTTAGASESVRLSKNITGGATAYGLNIQASIRSDVTGAYLHATYPTTQATAFTLGSLRHYSADQNTFGAGSTVTNQYGFMAEAGLTGATNNYGFYGNIAAGTNRYNMYMAGTAPNYFAGNVGIGGLPVTGYQSLNYGNWTGSTTYYGVASQGAIQSDVTSSSVSFRSAPNTAAAAFTLSNLNGFLAEQGTIGAGSTVTKQYGFRAADSLVGATNNYGFCADNTASVTAGKTAYGFYNAVNTATGGGTTWGFYSGGTANNAFAGKVRVGGVTAPVATLDVTGTLVTSSSIQAASSITARTTTSTNGYISLQPGTSTNSGYMEFMSHTTGARQGYIGFSGTNVATDTGTLPYVAGTHAFTGAITATGGVDKLTTASGVVSVAAATAPSTGQVLMATSATTATWQTPAAGGTVTLSDDTATNATYYPTIATATSGTLSALKVSSTKFTFNPSTGTMSATILNSLSDANFKTNVVPLTDSAEVVKALQGVSFDWKDGSGSSYGFIAQEVQKIIPHAVSENDNKLGVNYSAIVPFLVETIKTQEDRIARLEEMVAKLLKA